MVDCSKVYVKSSPLGGVGAFAAVPIKKGEVVEYGLMRRVDVEGNRNPAHWAVLGRSQLCRSKKARSS